MHEQPLPEGPVSAVADGLRTIGAFAKNAAVSVVEGVEHDGATLVGKNVGIGARVEAGLNIAADVASVVTGPEDIAAERAAVFAVKEGAEHAPQIAEAGVTLGIAAVREAPEIAKSATVVFDKAASIIKTAGHELVDSQPSRGILETKHAIYSVAEEAEAHLGQVGELFGKAWEEGKNFAIHGPNLDNAAVNEIEKLRYGSIAKKQGFEAIISRSEHNLERALGELEKSHAVHHALSKSKELVKGVTDALETTGKIGEFAKKGIHRAEAAAHGASVSFAAGAGTHRARYEAR